MGMRQQICGTGCRPTRYASYLSSRRLMSIRLKLRVRHARLSITLTEDDEAVSTWVARGEANGTYCT
jgi:hypothetical protein